MSTNIVSVFLRIFSSKKHDLLGRRLLVTLIKIFILHVLILEESAIAGMRIDVQDELSIESQLSNDSRKNSRLLAFVVGINKYENLGPDQQLTRAARDASDVGKTLEELGFSVVGGVGVDINRDQFQQRWKNFVNSIEPGRSDTVVIYLSGHGMAIEEKSLFLTKNAPFKRAGRQGELERESILLSELMLDLQARRPRLGLIIVDACRTNPFIPNEFNATTLGGVSITGDGILTVYAAGGNEPALDRLPGLPADTNRNSVFGRALIPKLKLLKESSVPLYLAWVQQLQREVRDIAAAAGSKQTPKFYSGLEGEFCLLKDCNSYVAGSTTASNAPSKSPPAPSKNSNPTEGLQASNQFMNSCSMWRVLANSNNEAALLSYVGRYRGQPCTEYARIRIDALIKKRSTLHIVSIGVGEFLNKEFSTVELASKDANDISYVLKTRVGAAYGKVEHHQLVDLAGTKLSILAKLRQVQKTAKSSDTVIVYISGIATEINGQSFFMPANAKANDISTYINFSEIQKILANTFGHRILFFDSCGVSIPKSINPVLIEQNKNDQISVLAAAMPGELVRDFPQLKNGTFTHALIRALNESPVDPEKKVITIENLGKFVSFYVPYMTARQHPFWFSSESNFILVHL